MSAANNKLTNQQIEDLYQRKNTGDLEARKILIESNLGLVTHIAAKYNTSSIEFDDRFCSGAEGLIRAIDRFDIKRGASKFASYISKAIENAILMEFRKQRKSDLDISIETPIGEDLGGDDMKLGDTLIDDSCDLMGDIMSDARIELIKEALSTLKEADRELVILRYLSKHIFTQSEIAKLKNVSGSAVSKNEKQALIKLRHSKAAEKLKDFLEL